ncbi:Tn3 family transposase post-transcriptional regulator TnpC, partial [Cupriavidus lacunae]|uniref:Tn3 family transposase post-transcriptional regulator TnpC n=1 Tax=Cupriavidus lacunae TaxID=2666307 RepID=UPI002449D464
MPDIETPYGAVDADALQSLRQRYDTLVIQRAVDQFDSLRARCGPDGLRDDLLRLHGMAHTVINGAILSYSTDDMTLLRFTKNMTTDSGLARFISNGLIGDTRRVEEAVRRCNEEA